MEITLTPERIPGPNAVSQQSSQGLFTHGYKYKVGTLYDNTRVPQALADGAPRETSKDWVASLEVPKAIDARYGDRKGGWGYEQSHTTITGSSRDEVMNQAKDWFREKLEDYQSMERKWLARIDAMPVLPGDYIHPDIENGSVVYGRLLAGSGDSLPVILTPRQFMAACHSYHNQEFDQLDQLPPEQRSGLSRQQFQIVEPELIDIQTGAITKMRSYRDMNTNRVQWRIGLGTILFSQAEYGMDAGQQAEYRDGLLKQQAQEHSEKMLYVIEKPNGYSPTGWQAVSNAMCSSEKQAVEFFHSVPDSTGAAMDTIGLRRLVRAEGIKESGNFNAPRYADNPRVIPVNLQPAGRGVEFPDGRVDRNFVFKLSSIESCLAAQQRTQASGGPGLG